MLVLCGEMIVVCSEKHKTQVNASCVQDVEFFNVSSNHREQPVGFKGLKKTSSRCVADTPIRNT